MPEFMLDKVDQHDYETAGSKFITMHDDKGNPITTLTSAHAGKVEYRDVECGALDWDTQGKSMKIPITIIEVGPDEGKEDKISFGVDKNGIWKGKALYKNVTGKDMPMKADAKGVTHPAPKSEDTAGKKAVAMYIVLSGKKGGDPNAEDILYPKLQDILPAGFKPTVKESGTKDVGI